MENLPEIKDRIWINVRGAMRTIPVKGFYIITLNESGETYFEKNEYPASYDTLIFKDGVLLDNVTGFKIKAHIDDILSPSIQLEIFDKNIEIEGLVERK